MIDVTYLKTYHSEANRSLLGAWISSYELAPPLLEIVLQDLNNARRLLDIPLSHL